MSNPEEFRRAASRAKLRSSGLNPTEGGATEVPEAEEDTLMDEHADTGVQHRECGRLDKHGAEADDIRHDQEQRAKKCGRRERDAPRRAKDG